MEQSERAVELLEKRLAELAKLNADVAEKEAIRDREIAEANEACDLVTADIKKQAEQIEAAIKEYCTEYREEIFGKKKTTTIHGFKIGFEFGKPMIESLNGQPVNEENLLQAILDQASASVHTPKDRELLSSCYQVKPKLVKTEVKKLPEHLWPFLNIVLRQTEEFKIRPPKS